MSASDYLENKILNDNFGAGRYVALYSTATGETVPTELSGNGYARQALTVAASSGGAIANTTAVTFAASGGAWPAALSFGLHDAATAGNYLGGGALSASRTASDGDSIEFAIGDLNITTT